MHSSPRSSPGVWLLSVAVVALLITLLVTTSFDDANGQLVQTTFRLRLTGSESRQKAASCQVESTISGTTGRQFKGEKVRHYQATRMFTQQQQQQQQAPQSQPQQQASPRSPKWAVCTTVFTPSQQILDTLKIKGWHMVVVGDKGAVPFDITASNLVYLDVAGQEQLGQQYPDLLKLLPWKHFGRKNLGYLYAIAHGAEQIWDFDDDNGLKPGISQPAVPSSEVYQVLAQPSCEAFNPYPLMGAPREGVDAWPRGMPLQLIRRPCLHALVPSNMSRVAIVQSLADHEPDVDGIFRLTRNIPFEFDPASKRSLVIPRGTLAPYNAQATLVLHAALFTQLLPVTVHGRVSDIWRSFIAQRLLWDVGYQISFAPPMVTQLRNPHNYLADMQSEEPLYYRAGALVQHLRDWRGTAPTIAGRFEELMIDLYERQYIELQDVQLAQQWLSALHDVGYSFPSLTGWSPPTATTRKAAVCVSGQLRSVHTNINNTAKNLFGVLGDYDVFVFVQSRGSALEPRPGDTRACDVFKRPEYGNASVYCQVVEEKPVNVSNYIPTDLQQTYSYAGNNKLMNGLIQQLLGLQGCWNMAKQHSFTTGIQYEHLVRIRPDNWLFDPLPPLSRFNESKVLYIPSIAYKCCGNEDIFHVSSWEVAEVVMNRVDNINKDPTMTDLRKKHPWIAEDLVKLTTQHNKIKIIDHPELHVHVERRQGQPGGSSEP